MTKARRPNLYVVNALKRRYGLAKGRLRAVDLFSDRDAIRADMGHLAAVLAMFEPGVDLDAIPPIRPHPGRRGRWTRTALEIMKGANRPLKAWELARLVIMRHGLTPERALTFSIACGLQQTLGKLADEGLVKITGKPRRWSIPRD